MARSRSRMELGDGISSRRRTGRSSQFGKTAAQIAREENDYYAALEYLTEDIREIAKADMDKNKSAALKTESKKVGSKAGFSTSIKNSSPNKTNTNSMTKDTEYALEYLPEEIRVVAEADIARAEKAEEQRIADINSFVESSNMPEDAKADAAKSMIDAGTVIGNWEVTRYISPKDMELFKAYYGSEAAAREAIKGMTDSELKNVLRAQSNKEQDALYDMGRNLSDEDQQMVDDIRASWDNKASDYEKWLNKTIDNKLDENLPFLQDVKDILKNRYLC